MKVRSQSRRAPTYRHHKPTDQAFVELNGKRHYLGKHGTPHSRADYKRLVAEWDARGRRPLVSPSDVTVVELLAAFILHAETYYRRPDGTHTSEVGCFKLVTRLVEALYGDTLAIEFGPIQLKSVRQKMIAEGWSRNTVNKGCSRVRLIFRWGAAEGMIPATAYQALTVVSGLKRGRSDAHEGREVKPVPEAHIAATREHVCAQVWALIQLQLLTGARSGEIVGIRPVDIDMSSMVWTYMPAHHKNAYRGHGRTIYIGPRGQEIIRPFLAGRAVDQPIFSPKEAEADRLARLHMKRVTPMNQGNVPGSNRKRRPKVVPGDAYDVASYRRAIDRACKLAGVPHWHPHQLRHNAATNLRREFGIEAARVILGHRSPLVTELYAELDREKALAIVERVG